MEKLRFCGFFLTLLVACGTPSVADFICRADINYKWQRNSLAKPTQAAPESTPPAADSVEGSSVFWSLVERTAATEEDCKALINKAVFSERADAERSCVTQHENLSGCIAGKFSSLAGTMGTMDFAARKAMEKAIQTDCEQQQGKCLGSSVSEIKCVESVVPGKTGAAEGGKDAKDKKDKEKKK